MKNLAYYGLKYNPFEKEVVISVDLLDHKEMLHRLNYLKRSRGIGLYTGASGTGKTFTMKQFVDSLNPQLYKVCYLSMSTLTTMDFYRSLAIGLNLEPRSKKIELFHQIRDRILELYDRQRITPVIILDEAQHLKGEVLQDLVMLFNFDMDTANKCIVIMTGLPSLNVTLSRAILDPLRQRIISNYQIVGIEADEVENYIEIKLRTAGRSEPLFTKEAIAALVSNSLGSIRRLNVLLSHSLNIGQLSKSLNIDQEVVFKATDEMAIN
ncbi:MAG: AAA family ATPase [Erysipelothrix sp.]|nr:AAA family ATPase [Erysipelothrix sp.]